MAHDVFISYASANRAVAQAACARLEQAGLRCWMAPRDIIPGKDWGESINQAIENARIFVLVFSDHANASKHVPREVIQALDAGATIIPLRIEGVDPRGPLRYSLATVHWLDAVTPPLDRHLGQLVDTVGTLLGEPIAPLPTPPPGGEGRGRPRRSPRALAVAGAVVVIATVAAFAISQRGAGPDVEEPTVGAQVAVTQEDAGANGGAAAGSDAGPAIDAPARPSPQRAATSQQSGAGSAGDPSAPPEGAAPALPLTAGVVLITGDQLWAARSETPLLRRLLTEGGLGAVDGGRLVDLRSASSSGAGGGGDPGPLLQRARVAGVATLLIGDLTVDVGPAGPQMPSFFTGRASLELRMYDVESGALVGADGFQVGGAGRPGKLGSSEGDAGRQAVDAVSELAAAAMVEWLRAKSRDVQPPN